MSGTTLLLMVGGVGFAGGVLVGRWWGKKAHENIFINDSGEAVEVRAEAVAQIADRTERRLARIVQLAAERGRVVNDDVEDLFCISDRTASAYLTRLARLRRLTRVGDGRGTYYVPVGAVAPSPQPEAAGAVVAEDGTGETGAAQPRPKKRVIKKVAKNATKPAATTVSE